MLIVFDLDGTLIDSSKDLAIAMNATREHLGMPPIDPNLIYSFVGNGVRVLVQRALGENASKDLVDQGYQFFLTFYGAHAVDNTSLYPGIEEILERLSAQHKLAILTNKPVEISYKIVKNLQLEKYFLRVYGGDSFSEKKPAPVGIHVLMQELKAPSSEVLMVGDSSVDVETARNANVKSCGVSWGFQPESLKKSGPDLLINDPADILEHVD
ncbi:MAG TPA: HAD-IA family hydrolase [Bryobacteraceae bacterium]|nr:HAD-IA family hydrolase [Bryobacteraceae bacterium]